MKLLAEKRKELLVVDRVSSKFPLCQDSNSLTASPLYPKKPKGVINSID